MVGRMSTPKVTGFNSGHQHTSCESGCSCSLHGTVKFLNFWTPENFAVIYLKFKQRGKTWVFCQNGANGIANSEDRSCLIWVCTICPHLSVPKLRVFSVLCVTDLLGMARTGCHSVGVM